MPYWMRIGTSVVVVMLLVVAILWRYRRTPVTPARPVAQASTARPTDYVNEKTCADCHAEQAEKHQKTGHANTFRKTIGSTLAHRLAGQTFPDPERGGTFQYHFDEQSGLAVTIPDRLGKDPFPLTYEFGSGHNAVTFLTLLPDRFGDTVGVEHRVSMYRTPSGWELDLTPGHVQAGASQEVEQFGRVMRGDTLTRCIGCHTVTAEIQGLELVDLRPHVGCQSCHGPGRDHVQATESNGVGNYAGFSKQSAARELEVCGRCHRLPQDPAGAHFSADIVQNVRFQPAGLVQSRCYTVSGELGCSTCHDPHEPVSRDSAHYVERCLSCHGPSTTATCPVSPRENCVPCHMPAITVHRDIKFHDHWIRVRRDQDTGSAK